MEGGAASTLGQDGFEGGGGHQPLDHQEQGEHQGGEEGGMEGEGDHTRSLCLCVGRNSSKDAADQI